MLKTALIVGKPSPPLEEATRDLAGAGYGVECMARAQDAELRLLRETLPDVLVLDWLIGKDSGIELCRRLRLIDRLQTLPIVVLAGSHSEEDILRASEAGASCVVPRSNAGRELSRRIAGVVDASSAQGMDSTLVVGDIELDRARRVIRRRGRILHVGPTDYRLLERLMQSPGSVLSREELLRNVWGEEPINPRTVDVRIGRLRRSLLATWHTDPIVTVRGSGYAFKSRSLGAGKTRGAGAAAHARRHKVPT